MVYYINGRDNSMDIFDIDVLNALNFSLEGIFIENTRGDILWTNSAGAEMFGYTIEEIITMNIKNFVPSDEKYYLQKNYEQNDLFPNEYIVRKNIKKDGTIIQTEINSKLILSKGVEYLIAYIRKVPEEFDYESKLQNIDVEANSYKREKIDILNSSKKIKCEVKLSNVLYIESKRNKLFYHLKGKKLIDGYGTLNLVQEMLEENHNFIRCHQSYIVNMDFAKLVEKECSFVMESKDVVGIRNRNYGAIKKIFTNYISNN